MWSIPSAKRVFRRGSLAWAPYSALPTNNVDLASAASTPRSSFSSTVIGNPSKFNWKAPLVAILGFGFLCVFILVNLDNIPLAWSNFIAPDSWFGGKECQQVVLSLNATAATLGAFRMLLSRPGSKGVALDETKILLPATSLSPARPLLQPIEHRLPYHIMNQYLTNGTLPQQVPPAGPIDIVYTWVNSTSEEFSGVVRERWEGEDLGRLNGERRWRDNGELRGAVHSAVHAFKDSLRTVHILSGDYPIDTMEPTKDEEGRWTMGQIPRWLNWANEGERGDDVSTSGPDLKWHFHRDIFRLPYQGQDIKGWTEEDQLEQRLETTDDKVDLEEAWQALALPNFNSFAIESRLGFVDGCHENFITSNDDMFFLKDFSAADYHHPLLGSIIRSGFSNHLMAKTDYPESMWSTDGEWGGLRHASNLLHVRFNSGPQPYPDHIPKSLSVPLLDEAQIIWSEEMSLSAIRGFRISKRGEGDIATVPLVQWLRMERWREALLWTWIVGKMGGIDGVWTEDAKDELKRVLGVFGDSDKVTVPRKKRATKDEVPKLVDQVGWKQPKQTWVAFTSFDGHVSSNPQKPADSCEFTISKCLPADFSSESTKHSANDIFKHMAFAERECGDCLITALVSASGERGLHAFLPDENTMYHPPQGKSAGEGVWNTTEPVLPMTKTWQEASFGLEDVVRRGSDLWFGETSGTEGINLRKWSIKLLTRYHYAMGSTGSALGMVHSPAQLTSKLKQFEDWGKAMVCINDDQPDGIGEEKRQDTKERFAVWMQDKWGGDGGWDKWENQNVSWV